MEVDTQVFVDMVLVRWGASVLDYPGFPVNEVRRAAEVEEGSMLAI